ncbi:hypothetical protein Patl1_29497 [Pistacia atlantica]|uniref:Uncharacterized protein n=1 Tax=Pistacia atlantica TaxID=434234 RepID=A0ACC1A9U3_9ROSI|nr:hypothetical protein Patl1_29497 [Pistacia atlantica]
MYLCFLDFQISTLEQIWNRGGINVGAYLLKRNQLEAFKLWWIPFMKSFDDSLRKACLLCYLYLLSGDVEMPCSFYYNLILMQAAKFKMS